MSELPRHRVEAHRPPRRFARQVLRRESPGYGIGPGTIGFYIPAGGYGASSVSWYLSLDAGQDGIERARYYAPNQAALSKGVTYRIEACFNRTATAEYTISAWLYNGAGTLLADVDAWPPATGTVNIPPDPGTSLHQRTFLRNVASEMSGVTLGLESAQSGPAEYEYLAAFCVSDGATAAAARCGEYPISGVEN